MQIANTWGFMVGGLTIGTTLGFIFYFFGFYSGAVLRWSEKMWGGRE